MAVRYAEWITPVGNAYFSTNFKPNQDTRVVLDAELSTTTTAQALFGSRKGYQNTWFALYTHITNNGYEDGYANAVNIPTATYTGRVLIDKDRNVTKVNGTTISEFTYTAFQSDYPIYLFTINNAGSDMTASRPNTSKYTACQIYDNGTLIHDYRAALDPNGVACFYDKATKTYEYGIGTFTAGAEIVVPAVDFGTVCRMPLRIGEVVSPVNYVEWLKSDGNAYFDTGVKAKSTVRVKMKAQMLDNSISTPFLFGARNSGTDSAFCFFYHTSASAWKADYQTSNNRYTFDTTAVPKTGELEIDFNKNVWTVNGVSKTFTAATFASNYNLVLFANNTAGTIADHCPALIEYCQIYDNDVLIKDYKSAVDSDGVACFYDKVSKTYEYGVGTFIAGASISGGDTTPTGYTITISGDLNSSYGYATINDTKYTSAQTVTAEAGTSISVYVRAVNTSEARSYVKMNGTQVQTGNGTYTFVPSGNTTIVFTRIASDVTYFACEITTESGGSSGGGTTPAPKEYAVNITGTGWSSDSYYVTYNGVKYTSAQTIAVTEGDRVDIYHTGGTVYLNGQTVQQIGGTYNYTVNSNITIDCYKHPAGFREIYITTE